MRSTASKVKRVRCLGFCPTVRRLISAKFMTWCDNDLKTTRSLGADGPFRSRRHGVSVGLNGQLKDRINLVFKFF